MGLSAIRLLGLAWRGVLAGVRFWLYCIGFITLFVTINFAASLLFPVTRAALELPGSKEPDRLGTCAAQPMTAFWQYYGEEPEPGPPDPKPGLFDPKPWDYDRELAANEFAQYAALATNTYFDKTAFIFDPAKTGIGWTFQGRTAEPGGFSADVYVHADDDVTLIAVVFRGTDGVWALDDNLSNASWVFGVLNPFDQYSAARRFMIDVRKRAVEENWANGGKYAFIAIGHSLGGGLAKHVAAGFPCTSAITFDGSFVTNNYKYQQPYRSHVIDIFEDKDWLTGWKHRFLPPDPSSLTAYYQYYRFNAREGDKDQHGIEFMARSLSRTAISCLARESCAIPRGNNTGRSVMCVALNNQTDAVRNTCQALKPSAPDFLYDDEV